MSLKLQSENTALLAADLHEDIERLLALSPAEIPSALAIDRLDAGKSTGLKILPEIANAMWFRTRILESPVEMRFYGRTVRPALCGRAISVRNNWIESVARQLNRSRCTRDSSKRLEYVGVDPRDLVILFILLRVSKPEQFPF